MFGSLTKDAILETTHAEFFPDFLPMAEILYDNRSLATKNNGLCQGIRLRGTDVHGSSYEQLELGHNIRRSLFANEAYADKVKFLFFSQRKEVEFESNTHEFEGVLREVTEKYNKHFTRGYITELTIVVTMPLGKIIRSKTGIPEQDYKEENILLRKKVQELTNIVQGIISLLKEYDAKPLMHTDDGKSPLLSFWMGLANGGQVKAASKQKGRVGHHVSFSNVEFNARERLITFDDGTKKTYGAFLSLNAYPSESTTEIFDSIMQLQLPLNMVQSFVPNHPEKTKRSIQGHMRNISAIRGFTAARMNDLVEAANYVESGELNFHDHVFMISVFGNTKEEIEKHIHAVEKILAPSGIHLIREGWNLHGCFFGQFPDGDKFLNGRKVQVNEDNLAHFITLSGGNEGHKKSPFGEEPVTYFKKPDGSIYNFTFHPNTMSDVAGHTFICGASGSGKTTVAMFLVGQCLKYMNQRYGNKFKTLLFDSGKGAKIPTLAFGGSYHTVMQDEILGLNPLTLEDTVSNREFLQQFIEMLAGGGLDDKERALVIEAIRQNYQLDFEDRRLREIEVALGQQGYEGGKATLKSKLSHWLLGNERNPSYSKRIFNGDKDTLEFANQIVGFDMTQVLKDKRLLAPLAAYIFHKFTQLIEKNPTPHMIFIDEAVQYLNHPLFGDYVLKMIREQRKKNGIVVLAGQEPTVLTGSENGRAAMQNIDSFLIWPNRSGKAEDYMEEGLGLNEREFEWVKHPRGKREVMLKRKGAGSVILNVDLSCLGEHLHLLATGAEKVKYAEDLMRQNPEGWLTEYLKHYSMN